MVKFLLKIFFGFFQISTDTSDLHEPEQVRGCQEKALHALQTYTLAHYSDAPSKFGELLLRIPELQRTCQVKHTHCMLSVEHQPKSKYSVQFCRLEKRC